MQIQPVRTEEQYRQALQRIDALMDAEENTPEGDELDVLATLVEAYERRHFPIGLPDPVEAIKFHMEQNGLAPTDLTPYIGRTNRVYEILNRTRELSLTMIRKLHDNLGIPAEILIQQRRTAS